MLQTLAILALANQGFLRRRTNEQKVIQASQFQANPNFNAQRSWGLEMETHCRFKMPTGAHNMALGDNPITYSTNVVNFKREGRHIGKMELETLDADKSFGVEFMHWPIHYNIDDEMKDAGCMIFVAYRFQENIFTNSKNDGDEADTIKTLVDKVIKDAEDFGPDGCETVTADWGEDDRATLTGCPGRRTAFSSDHTRYCKRLQHSRLFKNSNCNMFTQLNAHVNLNKFYGREGLGDQIDQNGPYLSGPAVSAAKKQAAAITQKNSALNDYFLKTTGARPPKKIFNDANVFKKSAKPLRWPYPKPLPAAPGEQSTICDILYNLQSEENRHCDQCVRDANGGEGAGAIKNQWNWMPKFRAQAGQNGVGDCVCPKKAEKFKIGDEKEREVIQTNACSFGAGTPIELLASRHNGQDVENFWGLVELRNSEPSASGKIGLLYTDKLALKKEDVATDRNDGCTKLKERIHTFLEKMKKFGAMVQT